MGYSPWVTESDAVAESDATFTFTSVLPPEGACGQREAMLLLLLSRFGRVRLCATPWTAAYQAPPSMGFSRQEYWSRVPLSPPERGSGN